MLNIFDYMIQCIRRSIATILISALTVSLACYGVSRHIIVLSLTLGGISCLGVC